MTKPNNDSNCCLPKIKTIYIVKYKNDDEHIWNTEEFKCLPDLIRRLCTDDTFSNGFGGADKFEIVKMTIETTEEVLHTNMV